MRTAEFAGGTLDLEALGLSLHSLWGSAALPPIHCLIGFSNLQSEISEAKAAKRTQKRFVEESQFNPKRLNKIV